MKLWRDFWQGQMNGILNLPKSTFSTFRKGGAKIYIKLFCSTFPPLEKVEPNILFFWFYFSTFRKGGAKIYIKLFCSTFPPLEKVEPNILFFWFYFLEKGKTKSC
jgi:hypothetical protein